MKKESAGLLVYKKKDGSVEVLLVHPGGPIWGRRDMWSIPKGELDPAEDHKQAAFREFEEELGIKPPAGELIDLGSAKQGSKTNFIWALEGHLDITDFICNSFTMEWPPKSGKMQEFPENDRAEWTPINAAMQKIFPAQLPFLERLARHLKITLATASPSPQQQSLL